MTRVLGLCLLVSAAVCAAQESIAPHSASVPGPPATPVVDFDSLRGMVRALLNDRFQLATHSEVQSVNVYALMAPKQVAKLKKADESSRVRFAATPGAGAAAANPMLNQSWTCKNITMA